MDEGNERQRFVSRRAGDGHSAPPQRTKNPSNPPAAPAGGGLLSRFGGAGQDERGLPPENANAGRAQSPAQPPRFSIPAKDPQNPQGRQPDAKSPRKGALQAFGGQARRLGDNFRRAVDRNRRPQAGNWRASDFDPDVLEDWDRNGSAPFELPPDPDESSYTGAYERDGRYGSRAYDSYDSRESDVYDETYDAPRSRGGRNAGRSNYRTTRGNRDDWDDDEYADAGWETGTWDTGWATDFQPSVSSAAAGWGDEDDYWSPGSRQQESLQSKSIAAPETGTIARLSNVATPLSRLARVRLLIRRRPAAAALLSFFLLGFLLTCCAPLLPVLRLGSDAADAYRRVQNLQTLFAGGTSSLLNSAKLQEAQGQVDGLSHDLYEINSLVSAVGAPLGSVSAEVRDIRLLTRIGFDLTSSADEGLQVAQTILMPLQGGALAANDTSPGITQADITQAQQVLGDANSRVQDALAAYSQLDMQALPSQLRPGSRLGKYLSLLPIAPQVLGELTTLMGSVSSLLGVGQPAYYLVLAMDRSELRPIGGFTGNYGILELDGGKQSKAHPLSLSDVYQLDGEYYSHYVPNPIPGQCGFQGPQPPEYYWWWPVRYDGACKYAWGLRDMGLSPSFPDNARTAMQIVEDTPNAVPNNAPLQGVIAFSPVLIEDLMQITGPISMPQWTKDPITPQNLEYTIHAAQLGGLRHSGTERKTFTHDLSTVMLAKIKSMHGAQLKAVFSVVEKALKSKDLEVYFQDPHAELILQQLGLAAAIRTGNGDGFYVLDTNDGGDKANSWVTEQQTDVVTLLPNGGAIHHLRIAVTYARKGLVWAPNEDDYNDLQRVYLPGDATVLGYSGYNYPYYIDGGACNPASSTVISDCTDDGGIHDVSNPVTTSDVPGRTMVMGALTVYCGPTQRMQNKAQGDLDSVVCESNPVTHTQTIYVEWYTPHAFTMDANGHGTYSEVVEKEPGSGDFVLKQGAGGIGLGDYLTVYVDTSQVHSSHPNANTTIVPGSPSDNPDIGAATFQQIIGHLKPVSGFNNTQLDSNLTVSVSF
jgi:hypothetical protein